MGVTGPRGPGGAWGGRDPNSVLEVENGGPWGDWGHKEFCPRGTYASAFALKVQPHQGWSHFGDDTGLNGVRLICTDGSSIQSSEGKWGLWQSPRGCGGGTLVQFRLRAEPPRGPFRDDEAATDVSMLCSNGREVAGEGSTSGDWGNWSRPCAFGAVCGLQTRVELPGGPGQDDTGLNDLRLFCCN
ncbi:vitelline membrane outer layer protein 1 homolog [Alligator mississippiensis]|uniref:vitelline membrane outer layer protein 1 homolog n=1 Tax=Alligator mississippiensis TaxID=8496 RepID=UPI0028780320|nr:vitelline membrane outer layer protein 1 homolog [Alligator mississippiensis]